MRLQAALLLVGASGALAASAAGQLTGGAASLPLPVSPTAPFPPANAGCGDGLTSSHKRPTVTLASARFELRTGLDGGTGRVHIHIRANQTAATFVKLARAGGRRVGGTAPGSYTCTAPGTTTVATTLGAEGVRLVRRDGRLPVKVTFRLINGAGVTHVRVWSGVIRPA